MFLHKQSPTSSLRLITVTLAAAMLTTVAGCSIIGSNAGRTPIPVAQPAPPPPGSPTVANNEPALVQINAPVPLAEGHPNEYMVKVGDTLWDIAATFLKDPWYWPEIWYVNPEIENPHLIYPGDVLGLVTIDGTQRVTNIRASTYRMSPQARITPLTEAISSIPYEAVSAFLTTGVVLEKKQSEALPYILETRGDHLLAASGNDVYVRGLSGEVPGTRFSIIHVGDPLIDPDNNRLVGYQGIFIGAGTLQRGGDPATVRLTQSTQEALFGDRLLSESVDIPLNFFPSAPTNVIDGRIMSVVNGVTQIGQYQVIVINRGARDGLAVGDILSVFMKGQVVKDRVKGGSALLPDEQAGTVMIFKVYDDIGYALVMEATQAIHIHDAVRNPI
jgi:hypothetical protein